MTASDVSWGVAGRIGTINIDRPPVNALRTPTWQGVERALVALAGTERMSAVLLRSASERIFSAGADVNELPMTPELDEARQQLTRRVLARVFQYHVPIVCAIPGPALGGACALAAACDIRLATRSASFGLPEINVGRCGGARYLMRVLPQGVVRHAYFTGRPITAEEAWRLGLVNELFDSVDQLDDAALALAKEIASKSPTAVRLAKQSLDLTEELSVQRGYEVEQQFSLRLAGTPDATEAAESFREKRTPNWVDE